jgi:HD-like signal output (HDOD) protein
MINPALPNCCSQPTADIVAKETRDLPVAMQVLPKLKELLQDRDSSMFAIVNLLRLDLGLTVRVLRVGNSAYYRRGDKCQTLEEAVQRVGYNQIYEIVAYAVASQVLDRPVPTYDLEVNDLWQRSIAAALAAKLLSATCEVDCDEAYTVGLLHNVGVVAIDNWMNMHCPRTVFVDRGFPHDWTVDEIEHLGLTQAEAGAALLEQWDFPKSIISPIRWQHNPRGTTAHQKLAKILFVARWVRTMICDAHTPPPPDAVILSQIGVTSIGLRRIINQVRSMLLKLNHLLETEQPDLEKLAFPGRK